MYMNKQLLKNIKNKTLKKCSINPMTGYNRDGYCRPYSFDNGSHLVCAKIDEQFLKYTASKGNDLSGVVKPNDNWCICQDRYYEAYKNNKAPKIVLDSTYKFLKPHVKKAILEDWMKNRMSKVKKSRVYNKNTIYKRNKTKKIKSTTRI
jgi:uncharacterized protein (DUF2237 family)